MLIILLPRVLIWMYQAPGSGRICTANVHVDYDFIIVHSIVIGSDYTTIVTLIEAEIRGSGQGCQFQYSILVYVR